MSVRDIIGNALCDHRRGTEGTGYMTPDGEAADAVLAKLAAEGYVVIADEPDHFVTFDPERWTVEHSVACRISGRMTQCEYHTAIAKVASEGVDTDDFGRWRITGVDSEGLPMLERVDG